MSWIAPLEIGVMMGLVFAWSVLALALAFRLLHFPDLTIEGSLPLGAALFAVVLRNDGPLVVALLSALVVGAIAGAVTGFIHVRFGLNKFLSGIIVIALAYSASLRIMGGSNIGLLQRASLFDWAVGLDRALSGSLHVGSLILLLLLLGLGAVLTVLVVRTRRGVRVRAAGSNPAYARSLGINISASVIVGLAVTNAMAAFSGALLASYQGFVDISMGQGVLILALASMTIGERLLPKRSLSFHAFVVVAAILGSIAYQVLVAYAVRAGLAPSDLKMATALLVLAVIALRVSKDGELLAAA